MRRVLQFLKDFANERKLAWQQDAVGNMVIKRTGTGGGEMAPAVVIQVLAVFLSAWRCCKEHAIVTTAYCSNSLL